MSLVSGLWVPDVLVIVCTLDTVFLHAIQWNATNVLVVRHFNWGNIVTFQRTGQVQAGFWMDSNIGASTSNASSWMWLLDPAQLRHDQQVIRQCFPCRYQTQCLTTSRSRGYLTLCACVCLLLSVCHRSWASLAALHEFASLKLPWVASRCQRACTCLDTTQTAGGMRLKSRRLRGPTRHWMLKHPHNLVRMQVFMGGNVWELPVVLLSRFFREITVSWPQLHSPLCLGCWLFNAVRSTESNRCVQHGQRVTIRAVQDDSRHDRTTASRFHWLWWLYVACLALNVEQDRICHHWNDS
jgi:hypothetical protein